MKIKAIIPAAGFGTRFLPFTKAVPKEMVPLGNKPAIQYIAQEIFDSGITDCIVITTPQKQAIANHFASNPELEQFLKEKNKLHLIADVQKLIQALTFNYINQEKALGLGHAVSLAKDYITENFCAVLLPDDIMLSAIPGIKQLIDIAKKENASVVAVQEVAPENVCAYGVIAIQKQLSPDLFEIKTVVEKPAAKDAPSNLAIIGRYILSSKIFKALDEIQPAANGELQLTDAIAKLITENQKVLAYKIQGTRFDVGTPTGWLAANEALSGF